MKLQHVIDAFEPWRRLHRRNAWRPIVERKPGRPSDSRFGGIPYLQPGEDWPTCGGCGRPLQLFLQLNLARLPKVWREQFDGGLLQFFHCNASQVAGRKRPGCQAENYGRQVFSEAKLLRIIHPAGRAHVEPPRGFKPIAPRTIVRWQRFDDVPDSAEHEALGLKYRFDYLSDPSFTIIDVGWRKGRVAFEGLREPSDGSGDDHIPWLISRSSEGDKLGGWPNWHQSVRYPECPRCKRKMQYVFQIDSEDNIPYAFGDVGCGRITRCAKHRELLAFTYECA